MSFQLSQCKQDVTLITLTYVYVVATLTSFEMYQWCRWHYNDLLKHYLISKYFLGVSISDKLQL